MIHFGRHATTHSFTVVDEIYTTKYIIPWLDVAPLDIICGVLSSCHYLSHTFITHNTLYFRCPHYNLIYILYILNTAYDMFSYTFYGERNPPMRQPRTQEDCFQSWRALSGLPLRPLGRSRISWFSSLIVLKKPGRYIVTGTRFYSARDRRSPPRGCHGGGTVTGLILTGYLQSERFCRLQWCIPQHFHKNCSLNRPLLVLTNNLLYCMIHF